MYVTTAVAVFRGGGDDDEDDDDDDDGCGVCSFCINKLLLLLGEEVMVMVGRGVW